MADSILTGVNDLPAAAEERAHRGHHRRKAFRYDDVSRPKQKKKGSFYPHDYQRLFYFLLSVVWDGLHPVWLINQAAGDNAAHCTPLVRFQSDFRCNANSCSGNWLVLSDNRDLVTTTAQCWRSDVPLHHKHHWPKCPGWDVSKGQTVSPLLTGTGTLIGRLKFSPTLIKWLLFIQIENLSEPQGLIYKEYLSEKTCDNGWQDQTFARHQMTCELSKKQQFFLTKECPVVVETKADESRPLCHLWLLKGGHPHTSPPLSPPLTMSTCPEHEHHFQGNMTSVRAILLAETLVSPWKEAPATAATHFRSHDLAMQRSGDHSILATERLGDHHLHHSPFLVPPSSFKSCSIKPICFFTFYN